MKETELSILTGSILPFVLDFGRLEIKLRFSQACTSSLLKAEVVGFLDFSKRLGSSKWQIEQLIIAWGQVWVNRPIQEETFQRFMIHGLNQGSILFVRLKVNFLSIYFFTTLTLVIFWWTLVGLHINSNCFRLEVDLKFCWNICTYTKLSST